MQRYGWQEDTERRAGEIFLFDSLFKYSTVLIGIPPTSVTRLFLATPSRVLLLPLCHGC